MPIDPRIPLMGIGDGRSLTVENPMQSLGMVYQIMNMLQDNRRAEELMRMQQGESAQRMALALEAAQRQRTEYGLTLMEKERAIREQAIADQARGVFGGAPGITDEAWEQLLTSYSPEVRLAATTQRNA